MLNVRSSIVLLFIIFPAVIKAIILDYYPKPPPRSKSEYSDLIWYSTKNETDISLWLNGTHQSLQKYISSELIPQSLLQTAMNCNYENPVWFGHSCFQSIHDLHPCNLNNGFGFDVGAPCIFLVLDEINGWSPKPYNDVNQLPEEMPEDLKKFIYNETKIIPHTMNSVWISCEGETASDVENIGPIDYIPIRGFPSYNFPITKVKEYMNPIIAIQLKKPTSGIAISVICKAWAKNLTPDIRNKKAAVNFEILVDDNKY